MQGSPPRRPQAGSAPVPGQHVPAEAFAEAPAGTLPDGERSGTTTRDLPALPALPGPRAALTPAAVQPAAQPATQSTMQSTMQSAMQSAMPSAVLPAALLPGARSGGLRTRTPAQPDVVVFTAACPACGQDCTWSEEREDTRLHAMVSCPCGR